MQANGESVHIVTNDAIFFFRKSASCTHISALLHSLVALSPPVSPFRSPGPAGVCDDEEALPITSYVCEWKRPRKRKESTMKISEATFEKHVYGRTKTRKFSALEDFDPRPLRYWGTATSLVPDLLEKVRGKGLCISLLLDPSTRHWSSNITAETSFSMPDVTRLKQTVQEFKNSLRVTTEKVREIERLTREQRNSTLWFDVRRHRLTASVFGEVMHRKAGTLPDSLVLRILQNKRFTSTALEWGILNEPIATQKYVEVQHASGHHGLTVFPSGFFISESYPFLGATPDGSVYDPTCHEQPYGFLEVKCPYSKSNVTLEDACTSRDFCCAVNTGSAGERKVYLKKSHIYYAQVQGQMGIGERLWCDFVIYTCKGITI